MAAKIALTTFIHCGILKEGCSMLILIALGAFNVYIDIAGQVLAENLTSAICIPYNDL